MTVQYRQPLLVLALVCAAFTCLASTVVLMQTIAGHAAADEWSLAKLGIRVTVFGGLAAVTTRAFLRGVSRPVHSLDSLF